MRLGAPAPPSPPVQPGTIVPDPMDTAGSPADSDASRHDPPPTAPLYERIFGKDPTAAEDPIVYDIRPLTAELTKEEKMAILNVVHWPASDLHDMTAGDPPDLDFSNAKPANQVNFSTFQTYIEPFIRPFTEEDVAFLKERGARDTPFTIPARGTRGYKEVWASEDGTTGIEAPQKHVNNPNEARGSIDEIEDELDTVSLGPTTNRLITTIRPAPSGVKRDTEDATEDANGDVSMVNGDDAPEQLPNGHTEDFKPTTCLPAEAPRPTNLPQLDYETFEQRALQELRYIGIIGPNEVPNYDTHDDDEVAERLRTLQHELRRVSKSNNIRKARVLELTEERMAMQEYSNIADDLDNQVNAAYLKRNRSLAKPNQKKGSQAKPGQKGVASGVAGRGVSDGVRALMVKRKDWIEYVGPVVRHGRPPIPPDDETIFDDPAMKRLEKVEREAEAELGDADGE
jgi:transcriptional adapter 3